MMEKRGRSPSLTRKNWVEPEPIYSVVEQKKLLTSAELKKVPIYSKYTVSSLLYAQNVKRPHPSDKNIKSPARRSLDKPPPIALSKVIMPTKTKSNEDNLSSSYTKTGSPKPEDTKQKPHPRNYVLNVATEISNNVKSSHQKQPTKGLGSSKTVKLRFHDDLLSSKDDHNLTTNYEECDKILITSCPSESNEILIVEDRNITQHLVEDLHGEIMESQQIRGDKILECELLVPTSICLEAGNADDDMHQSNACSDPADYVMLVESVSSEEHLNDRNDETNQQDQACETLDVGGDHHHLTRPNADKENQKEVVDIGPKVVEDEQRKEPEAKKGGDHDEAPNKEVDLISKMVVAYQLQVVAHGKKDLATHNTVTEETISKLRQQRSNKEIKNKGVCLTRGELYIKSHTRKNGSIVNDKAAQVVASLKDLENESTNTLTEKDDFSNDDYSKIKGPEKRGYIRLIGRMPKVNESGASSSTEPQSQSVENLKSDLASTKSELATTKLVVSTLLNLFHEHIPNANLSGVLNNLNLQISDSSSAFPNISLANQRSPGTSVFICFNRRK